MTVLVRPTGKERTFGRDEIIVSKTDPKGIITYANQVFERVSGYTQKELIGAPHSLIRHPDMPRGVFRLLWDTISQGEEIFAYVVNLSKNGDHYWVLAHVTPTFDSQGQIKGYHSSRRLPARAAIQKVEPIYQAACQLEARFSNVRQAAEEGLRFLQAHLEKLGKSYSEFVFDDLIFSERARP